MKPLGTLRFFLAFAVLYAHSHTLLEKPLINPSLAAALGVLMFFTLSGYIISFTVERWYRDRPVAFLANRAMRIYPTHIACYVFALLVLWQSPTLFLGEVQITREGLTPLEFAKSLLILPASGFQMNPPIWTVLLELQFYLFVGVALLFKQRLAILWSVGMLVSLITIFRLNPAPALIDFSFDGHGYLFSFFVLGAALYYKRSRMAWPIIAAALAAVVVYIYKIWPASAEDHNQLMLAVLAVLVAIILLEKKNRASSADRFLGDLSYPLYACHVPILTATAQGWHGFTGWLLACAICIAAAIALRFLVERPTALIRARIRQPAPQASIPLGSSQPQSMDL